jgi:hypothetical protein
MIKMAESVAEKVTEKVVDAPVDATNTGNEVVHKVMQGERLLFSSVSKDRAKAWSDGWNACAAELSGGLVGEKKVEDKTAPPKDGDPPVVDLTDETTPPNSSLPATSEDDKQETSVAPASELRAASAPSRNRGTL